MIDLNFFGILLSLLTLFIIGLGFVWVIRGERFFGYLLWPYPLALGVLLIAASLWIPNDWGSALSGVFGAAFIWGATELKEQAVRADLGWYPKNMKKIRLPLADLIRRWKAPHL
jgi:hypothetical protein